MDRFDLTLECIRRWYQGIDSPLHEHIERYRSFFQLFLNFQGYCNFFLLNDLIDEAREKIRFWLPFEGFGKIAPLPGDLDEYLEYRKNVSEFTNYRNLRMIRYIKMQDSNFKPK